MASNARARAFFAPGWADFGRPPRMLAILCSLCRCQDYADAGGESAGGGGERDAEVGIILALGWTLDSSLCGEESGHGRSLAGAGQWSVGVLCRRVQQEIVGS